MNGDAPRPKYSVSLGKIDHAVNPPRRQQCHRHENDTLSSPGCPIPSCSAYH